MFRNVTGWRGLDVLLFLASLFFRCLSTPKFPFSPPFSTPLLESSDLLTARVVLVHVFLPPLFADSPPHALLFPSEVGASWLLPSNEPHLAVRILNSSEGSGFFFFHDTHFFLRSVRSSPTRARTPLHEAWMDRNWKRFHFLFLPLRFCPFRDVPPVVTSTPTASSSLPALFL